MLNGDDNEKGFKTNASNKQKNKLHVQHTFSFFFYVQVTFTKNNLQQNENYNLKLTKKKPNTSECLKLEAPEIAKKSA